MYSLSHYVLHAVTVFESNLFQQEFYLNVNKEDIFRELIYRHGEMNPALVLQVDSRVTI